MPQASVDTTTRALFLALAAFALTGCATALSFNRQQAATISPAAQRFLRDGTVLRTPALTQDVLDQMLADGKKKNAELLKKYSALYDLEIQRETIQGVPVEIVTPRGVQAPAAVGLYAHGGAFILGSAVDWFAMRSARELGIPIVCVDYALSPRARFPVALEQSLSVYRGVLERSPSLPVVVLGRSAGGNLALAMVLRAREAGLALPRAVVAVTPWTDLTGSGDSYVSNAGRDIVTWNDQLDLVVEAYVGDARDRKDPLLSPVYADFSKGFPPTVITTGTRDLLLSDSVRLHWALRRAGTPTELLVFEGMWHAFNGVPDLPEGETCNAEVYAFVRRQLSAAGVTARLAGAHSSPAREPGQ